MSKRLGEKGDIAAFPILAVIQGALQGFVNVTRREMIGGFAAGGLLREQKIADDKNDRATNLVCSVAVARLVLEREGSPRRDRAAHCSDLQTLSDRRG